MTIDDCHGQSKEFEILNCFPFDSTVKKMGMIVRHAESSKIIYYAKGAMSEIREVLADSTSKEFLDREQKTAESEGLRTIVFA